MDLHCKKCLTSRTEDKLGQPCKTPGCDGVIEKVPAWNTLVDKQPEPMTCPRRTEISGPWKLSQGPDYWEKFKVPHGNRVCSFCGSLHPDDLFALVKQCAEASIDAPYGSVVEIEPSDKDYKIYIRQPGVRNAYEGGIKFYTPHLPRDADGKLAIPPERNDEYKCAVHATKIRFNRYLSTLREARLQTEKHETLQ